MSSEKLPKGQSATGDAALGQRIRQIRDAAKLTLKEFGEMLGVSDVAVMRYEKGERYPQHKILMRIAEFGKFSILWLTEGKEIEPRHAHEAAPSYNKSALRLPIVSRAWANPDGNIDFEALENEYLEIPTDAQVIQIQDDSMSPTLWHRQRAVIDPDAPIRDDDLVVIKLKTKPGRMFKRITYDRAKELYSLTSVNQAAPIRPILVSSDEIDEIALVIGGWYLIPHRADHPIWPPK